jgi:hypothetical protein
MVGGGSDHVALINAISNVIDPKGIERNWAKTSGGTGKKRLKKAIQVDEKLPEKENSWIDERNWDGTVKEGDIQIAPDDMFGDEAEEADDASEFEREKDQTPGAAEADVEELTDDDMDFDDDDLAKMFANLKTSEGDELDWS